MKDPVAATIRKANGESIRRHISDLILLEKIPSDSIPQNSLNQESASNTRPLREAARASKRKTNLMYDHDLV